MAGLDLHEEPEDLTTQTVMLNKYCFWYHKRHQKIGASAYEESITQIASFQTIEHFWRIYDHLIRVNDVKSTTDFHLFKHGIKPTWEDSQNEKGGKWMVRLKKGLSSRYWEDIVMAIIGEQFDVGHEICGAVISVRAAEDILSVWNKNSDNTEAKTKIRDQMKKILRLPTYVPLEYKVHRDSLTDGSSFRNTSVWRPTHAPRGSSWNGPEGSADPAAGGGHKSFHSSGHRTHSTQPPGGMGEGSSWGGSRPRQPHRSSWKPNERSQSGDATVPVVSTLGNTTTGEKGWGKSGSGGWGRPNVTASGVSGFQHKSPDDERGGNYGDASSDRSQKAPRDANSYISGRRYESSAGQHVDGQAGETKKWATPGASDKAPVWGRAHTVATDAAPSSSM